MFVRLYISTILHNEGHCWLFSSVFSANNVSFWVTTHSDPKLASKSKEAGLIQSKSSQCTKKIYLRIPKNHNTVKKRRVVDHIDMGTYNFLHVFG